MPSRPGRRCATPGCANPSSGGRCPGCKAGRAKATPPRPNAAALHGTDWPAISRAYREEHPICEWPRCGRWSRHVDHIDNDHDNHDQANLQALCHPHHSRKTATQDTPRAPDGTWRRRGNSPTA